MWVLSIRVVSTLLTETSRQPQNLTFEGRGGADAELSTRAFTPTPQAVGVREGESQWVVDSTPRLVFSLLNAEEPVPFFIH